MRAREPDAVDALHRPHRFEKLREQRTSLGDVATIGVDVLTEQGDLHHPTTGEHPCFLDDVEQWARDLLATHRGNDAIGTRVVTARLDGHPRRPGHLSDRSECRCCVGHLNRVRRIEDLGNRTVDGCLPEQHGGAHDVVRPNDHVDVIRPLTKRSFVLLREASGHRDLEFRPLCLEGPQVAQVTVKLVVGVLPDAAGVQHDDVCFVEIIGGFEAVRHQLTGEPLGIMLVHLAAEGANEELAGHPESVGPATEGQADVILDR